MEPTFRKSMAWLHTWAGVVIGSVLFTMFFMGSLSVFDREIDRWMMPASRLAPPPPNLSLDQTLVPTARRLAKGANQWTATLPTDRAPAYRVFFRNGGKLNSHQIDPRTGAVIEGEGSFGGTGFIFPFHYSLNLKWQGIGMWLTGLAAMAMLVLVVSGVVIHKKIFAEFFTFRPRKRLQRSSLDLHNLTAVVALPFHFMIALSGLVIFMNVYFPDAHTGAYGLGKEARAAFNGDAYGKFKRDKAGQPGSLSSVDAMVARAEQAWPGGKVMSIGFQNIGDANGLVEMRRSYAQDITMNMDQIVFDAGTGAVVSRFEAAPVMTVQRFISGLHFIQFDHWTLRCLYFVAGLAGCVMIATGFLFWLEARRASHAKKGLKGVRIVEGLTIGSVTGIILSTLVFLAANRLLPAGASIEGHARPELEMWAFYAAWVMAFAHAWWRPGRAWLEQAWIIAALALLCVISNAVTTGDHLLRTWGAGSWAVAGVDSFLLLVAVASAWAARQIGKKATAEASKVPKNRQAAVPLKPSTP